MSLRKNPKNALTVLRLHYTAHPTKRDPEWIAQAKKGMSAFTWETEMEINYTMRSGKLVYPEFDRDVCGGEHCYLPGRVMLRGWDFGYHWPAVVWSQFNDRGQWVTLREHIGHDIGIQEFAGRILDMTNERFPKATKFRDYGDPRGKDPSDKSEKTTVEILASMGIFCFCQKAATKRRIDLIRNLLTSGNFLVNELDCSILVEGFEGQYVYPDAKEDQPEVEIPEKINPYADVQDALGYSVLGSVVGRSGRQLEPEQPSSLLKHPLYPLMAARKSKEDDWYQGVGLS